MARFDVFRTADGSVVIDCQADLLSNLKTRFVVPLLPPAVEPPVTERLNPAMCIGDDRFVLYPQFAATVALAELDHCIGSLADHHFEILSAIDMLISGY